MSVSNTGVNTAQAFSYFQSGDEVVTLNFKIGLNIFSSKFNPAVSVSEFLTKNHLLVEFEPVDVNLRTDLRKEFNTELKAKQQRNPMNRNRTGISLISVLNDLMVEIPRGKVELRDDRINQKWTVALDPFLLSKFPVMQD